MAQAEKYMRGDIVPFAKQMKKLMNNKDASDIKFLIGSQRKPLYAHQCILSARCEVFRAMFMDQKTKSKGDEIPFVLSDTSPDVFTGLLEYIYTNCVTLNTKIAADVLGMSIEYGLDGLRDLCVDYMVDKMSVNTASEAMQAAVTYGQDRLQQAAMVYIEHNTQNVFKSKGFHEISDSALAVILQSNGLLMDEKDILDSVREWATVSAVVLGKPKREVAKDVIRHVRLPLLSADELKMVEEDNKTDALVPVDHISFAWKCHALRSVDHPNPLAQLRKGTVRRECYKQTQIVRE